MRVDILTLFPEIFPAYLSASIIGRALERGFLEVYIHNIRHYATGKHKITDEPPYGGGGGMVLKPEPIFRAVEGLLEQNNADLLDGDPATDKSHEPKARAVIESQKIILLTPQGRIFDQAVARTLAGSDRLILICGRYEGVDERVRQHLVTDEISIGDYVITGGELAALVVVDSIARLIPGVLGADMAADKDSHSHGILEGPQYTRPQSFRGWTVPEVLRSGHAKKIAQWRRQAALRRTWHRRPELLLKAMLSESDRQFLATLAEESLQITRE